MVISRYDWLKYSRKCIIRACERGEKERENEREEYVQPCCFPHSPGFLLSLSLSLLLPIYRGARPVCRLYRPRTEHWS